MKHKAVALVSIMKYMLSRHKLAAGGVAVAIVLLPVLAVAVSYAVIAPYGKYTLSGPTTMLPDADKREPQVGIVLGAGITRDGKPFRELQARLDVAADAVQAGRVDKLILSGDNRFHHYNEPEAMRDYLVKRRGIDASKLQEDFAGRSTYESCERASKVFRLKQAVIYSAGSHLPRAIYLCRQFGVQAYGVSSNAEANNALRREAVARVKALLNIHLQGEPTILGAPIKL